MPRQPGVDQQHQKSVHERRYNLALLLGAAHTNTHTLYKGQLCATALSIPTLDEAKSILAGAPTSSPRSCLTGRTFQEHYDDRQLLEFFKTLLLVDGADDMPLLYRMSAANYGAQCRMQADAKEGKVLFDAMCLQSKGARQGREARDG